MSACIQCGNPVENEAVTGAICQSCANKASGLDDALAPKVTGPAKIALGLAVVPFVISFRSGSSSQVTVNGQVVERQESHIDYVALPVGALVLVLGILAVVKGLKAPAAVRNMQLGAGAFAVLLGIAHVLRGVM